MKLLGGIVLFCAGSSALGGFIDTPHESDIDTAQTDSFADGGYSANLESNSCYESWTYKDNSGTTTLSGCVSVAEFPPMEEEGNPPVAPTNFSSTANWCYLGRNKTDGVFQYNTIQLIPDERRFAWKYCSPLYVASGEGFADEGTPCKGQWNFNNGTNIFGVVDACVPFSDALPQFTNSEGVAEFDAADFEGKSWCFTGDGTPSDTSVGYNPLKTVSEGGPLHEKTRQWGVCRDVSAAEETAEETTTSAPSTSSPPSSAPSSNETATVSPTVSTQPTGSPTVPTVDGEGGDGGDSNTGAIVGGILGAIAAIIVGVALYKYHVKSQSSPAKPESAKPLVTEQQQTPPQPTKVEENVSRV